MLTQFSKASICRSLYLNVNGSIVTFLISLFICSLEFAAVCGSAVENI